MLNLHSVTKPDISITDTDRKALQNLAFAAISVPEIADELLDELERARIVARDEAGRYIGIGTKATFVSGNEEKTVELVMPGDADISVGRISILTPVGVALLGLSEGQSINWISRDGKENTLTVLKIFAR